MAEQEVNLQYAYNSLMNRHAEVIKENSYKDAIIATQQEELNELRGQDDNKEEDE